MATLEYVLELVSEFPREAQNELEEILRQRRIEARRKEIADNGREAIRAFHAGELKVQTVEEIVAELYEGLDEAGNEL
jgi:vacuolar-type H+-ATPase subunit H